MIANSGSALQKMSEMQPYINKINELKAECERLNKIILKELSENDELGCEYTYVNALREQNVALVAENEKLKAVILNYDKPTADYVAGQYGKLVIENVDLKGEIEILKRNFESTDKMLTQSTFDELDSAKEIVELKLQNADFRTALDWYAKKENYIQTLKQTWLEPDYFQKPAQIVLSKHVKMES